MFSFSKIPSTKKVETAIRNNTPLILNKQNNRKRVLRRPKPALIGSESIKKCGWLNKRGCLKIVINDREKTMLDFQSITWSQQAGILKRISYQTALDIYAQYKSSGFYYSVDNYMYSVPFMDTINALSGFKKLCFYLTYDIKNLQDSKSQTPGRAWYGLRRAVSFFRYFGISSLNLESLYDFIIRNTIAENLCDVILTGPNNECNNIYFRARYIIPVPQTIGRSEAAQTLLDKFSNKLELESIPQKEEEPNICPFSSIELNQEEEDQLKSVNIGYLGNLDEPFYLEVVWQQDYDRNFGGPSLYGELITAVVLPRLRNTSEIEWAAQRKNEIAANVNLNIQ